MEVEYWEGLHRTHQGQLSAVGYSALGQGFNAVCYKKRCKSLHLALTRYASHLPQKMRLFEAAPGVGAYGQVWQSLGIASWVGMDISPAAIEFLKTKFTNGEFYCGDITSKAVFARSFSNRSFEIVTAIDVLYHITTDDSWKCALDNLKDLVCNQGVLVVSDIFCAKRTEIAKHVVRRPLSAYLDVLDDDFTCVGRVPIFAILADPVPDMNNNMFSPLLFQIWRAISKSIRVAAHFRAPVGGLAATMLSPIDSLLCCSGIPSGANLELAIFRRRNAPLSANQIEDR